MSDFNSDDVLDDRPGYNPYAAPRGLAPSGHRSREGGVWRDGFELLMTKDAVLPPRCLKCNQPAEGRPLKRSLSWHHPLITLVFLLSPLVYIIVALIVRKTATIYAPTCGHHRRRRRADIAIGWLGVLLGIGLMVVGIGQELPYVTVAGVVGLLVAMIYGLLRAQFVTPKKIDDHYVWLKGVSPLYLAELPDLYQAPEPAPAQKVRPDEAFLD